MSANYNGFQNMAEGVVADPVNGTPRIGKNTEPRNNPLNVYDWGGVYKP